MSTMATGVSTRQQILFHHPTYHVYHIYYEDSHKVGGYRDLEIFCAENRSGLHNKILTKLVQRLNVLHVILFNSPAPNLNVVLTNINVT